MSVQEKMAEDLKLAMKAKDSIKVETIRMVRAQMKNFQISKGESLNADDELSILTTAAKQRREAIGFYEKSDRQELLEKEKQELEIISEYLPKQLSKEEIKETVVKVIEEVGAKSIQEMGKVMSVAMKQLKGKAEGKVVQEIVRSILT